ncbi:MAG: hypothetical protein HF982_13810 [Desulfobacteraceae bacterium]|nr:hypothetical protein [Desulfobacteraceae bacterium]MBC2720635.1 hypothetical protein [Desulfobacteraceae bacterium]
MKEKTNCFGFLFIVAILALACISVGYTSANAIVCERTYTENADFDEGVLAGVEHETVHDQLQLSTDLVTLPFIWVPNSNEGTVSKYDTESGRELGRYRTGPNDTNGNPSRTTVDQVGSVWFGNRDTGTVVKIGLYEAGNWIDKNGDNICQTSLDTNNDGLITGAEVLDWGDDECVLFEVYIGGGPRGIAIDANGDLWAGTYSLPEGNKFFHIKGDTGVIVAADTIDISPDRSYGAVVDGNGYIWSSSISNYVLKIDPVTKIITKVSLDITSYGLGIDGNDNLFVAAWGQGKIAKIDVTTDAVLMYGNQGAAHTRGVAVTSDGDVWAVNSYDTQITRLDNNLSYKATIDIGVPGISTGAAVDAQGKVWACNYTDGGLLRIDPGTDTVDLSVYTVGMDGTGVGQHYSYSDMTGFISRNITTKIGTWKVIFDSEEIDTPWGSISWNSLEPQGTSIVVKVRSSNDQVSWSAWETATNSGLLSATPDGQYIEVDAILRITSGDESPILYDLSVRCANQPPDCTAAYAVPGCLWPPDHEFVDIGILGLTDPDGDPVTITILSISSDEPTALDEGAGGAAHAPDASGVGTDAARVRAERSGTEDGRVYLLDFLAVDERGGECRGSVEVKVPHDQDCPAIDSGQGYDATQLN